MRREKIILFASCEYVVVLFLTLDHTPKLVRLAKEPQTYSLIAILQVCHVRLTLGRRHCYSPISVVKESGFRTCSLPFEPAGSTDHSSNY